MQEKTSNKYSEVIQKYDFVSTKLDIKKNNRFDLLVIDPPWQQGKSQKS
jgi:16S rRNA G966 N2-methylase RsmD